MTTRQDRELTELHLSSTALYTPSRVSPTIPIYNEAQVATTVPLCRRYVSSPDASYMEYVREYITSSTLLAPGKPSHRRIPLPSQIESDNPTVVHPLLQPTRGGMMIQLDFARSLSSVRVLGHEGCINDAATNPPLPSLAIVHPKLPWPIVIQRSGDREWVTVADIVETLWHALRIRDPIPSASVSSFVENQKDVYRTTHGMSGRVERGVVHQPRLAFLRGKTRFVGLRAIEGDSWELLVV
ncbi:hypothetical protein ARMSODRAFT_1022431 [Armillaria solidipes]|uniref:DUF6699 domain-containing protein n=1 Tax=Armillaria solidipes TaxID=1076256 RepID=A0A2H3BQE4_9AGAR|nr:hypothetical protein ARMSODRAFT_1022431 [Armillaria solidipes]